MNEKPVRRQRKLPPVSSFGPEVMTVLLAGARERIEIGPMPYSLAANAAMRINKLRRAMERENHDKYQLVSRAKVKLRWGEAIGLPQPATKVSSRNVRYPSDPEAPTFIIIEPHDGDFIAYIIKSGIKKVHLDEDPLDEVEVLSPPLHQEPPVTIEDYLDKILKGKKDT